MSSDHITEFVWILHIIACVYEAKPERQMISLLYTLGLVSRQALYRECMNRIT